MVVKIIFSCIIVFCCGMIGEIFANGYRQRTRLLHQLIYTLQMLETEIVYSLTPLPQLLEQLAGKTRPEISVLLDTTAKVLQRQEGYTFFQAWNEGITLAKKHSELKKEDFEILMDLGQNLGGSDIDNQVKHIRLAMEGLKRNYEEALQLQQKNVSLYKHLGILAGLGVVIILF